MQRNRPTAYEIASKAVGKQATRNKRLHNSSYISPILVAGDRVLVKNQETGGPGQLRSYWEPNVYTVLRRIEDSPVYEVKREGGLGPLRRLHGNYLPVEKPKTKRLVSRGTRNKRRSKCSWQPSEESSTDSDLVFHGHILSPETETVHSPGKPRITEESQNSSSQVNIDSACEEFEEAESVGDALEEDGEPPEVSPVTSNGSSETYNSGTKTFDV